MVNAAISLSVLEFVLRLLVREVQGEEGSLCVDGSSMIYLALEWTCCCNFVLSIKGMANVAISLSVLEFVLCRSVREVQGEVQGDETSWRAVNSLQDIHRIKLCKQKPPHSCLILTHISNRKVPRSNSLYHQNCFHMWCHPCWGSIDAVVVASTSWTCGKYWKHGVYANSG